MCDGRCQFLFVQGTITDNHNFVKILGIRRQRHVDHIAFSDADRLFLVSDATEYKNSIVITFQRQNVMPVLIGAGTIVSSTDNYKSTWDWFAIGRVSNRTLD